MVQLFLVGYHRKSSVPGLAMEGGREEGQRDAEGGEEWPWQGGGELAFGVPPFFVPSDTSKNAPRGIPCGDKWCLFPEDTHTHACLKPSPHKVQEHMHINARFFPAKSLDSSHWRESYIIQSSIPAVLSVFAITYLQTPQLWRRPTLLWCQAHICGRKDVWKPFSECLWYSFCC